MKITLPWSFDETPLPVGRWRERPLMVAEGAIVAVWRFVPQYANQEGSHADAEVDLELAKVVSSARMYSIGGKPPDLGPGHVISVAECVAARAKTLLHEDASHLESMQALEDGGTIARTSSLRGRGIDDH